jgi:hypothetical protein
MRRHARTRKAAWLVALSFALTVLVVPPASAATLTAGLTPRTANAGARTTFTLTVTPSQGSLRSLSLTAPDGFFVGSATSTRGNPTVSGNRTVDVTGNLGGQTVTVTITAWPKCTPELDNAWTLSAVGSGSTTFDPVTLLTDVLTDVEHPSSCRLVFGEMADQLTVPPATTRTPVVVTVQRANGSTDKTFTGPISLSIQVDPGARDAMLTGGGTPITYVDGVATFSTSLNVAGTGYVLEACNPTINGQACDPDTGGSGQFLSELFAVYNSRTDCHGRSCSASASIADQVSTTVSANGQEGTSVKAGVFRVDETVANLSQLDCPGYDEITEVISSFDFNGSGIKTVVDVISAEQMKEIANQGVSFLQGCFGSSLPFKDRSGNDADFDETLGLYVGLLPDCAPNKKNVVAPCVVSRQGGGNGTGLFTYVAADGDPGGKRS